MIKNQKDAQRFFETVRELDYSYHYSNGQVVSARLFREEDGTLTHTVWAGNDYSKGETSPKIIWDDAKAINKALTALEKRS